jgi:hypothetical protein
MRDPNTYEHEDEGIDHDPEDAVAQQGHRPDSRIWNRIKHNFSTDILDLFDEAEALGDRTSGLSDDGENAEFEELVSTDHYTDNLYTPATSFDVVVVETDGEAVAFDSEGEIDSGEDHAEVIASAFDGVSDGQSCLCKGSFVVNERVSFTAHDATFVQDGKMTLDDEGDGDILAPFMINGRRQNYYNLRVDGDRENNTWNEESGNQSCILIGNSAEDIQIFGCRLENGIDSPLTIGGAENVDIYGLWIHEGGEHGVYCTGTDVRLYGPKIINVGQNIRSNAIKLRDSHNCTVVDGYVEYTGDEIPGVDHTVGVMVEDGCENIDVDVTVKDAQYAVGVQTRSSAEGTNRNINFKVDAYDCFGDAIVGFGDDEYEDVSIERIYAENTSLNTRGLEQIETAILRDGIAYIRDGPISINRLDISVSDASYAATIEQGADATIGNARLVNERDGEEHHTTLRVTDDGRVTLQSGHIEATAGGRGISLEGDRSVIRDTEIVESDTGEPSDAIRITGDDCQLWNVTTDYNISTGPADRHTIDNVGTNNGHPNENGEWEDNGREGVIIRDWGNDDEIYQYIDGSWYLMSEDRQ